MKLEEKGKILPPPLLNKYPQIVSAEIQQWNNIIAATHWNLFDLKEVDGADFYVGEEELGHIHLDGWVHLITNKEISALLIKNKLAEKFPYGQHWVMFPVFNDEQVKKAIALFKLNYDRITGVSMNDLMLKIETLSKEHN
jgi:Family of unknown function (DUF5519)